MNQRGCWYFWAPYFWEHLVNFDLTLNPALGQVISLWYSGTRCGYRVGRLKDLLRSRQPSIAMGPSYSATELWVMDFKWSDSPPNLILFVWSSSKLHIPFRQVKWNPFSTLIDSAILKQSPLPSYRFLCQWKGLTQPSIPWRWDCLMRSWPSSPPRSSQVSYLPACTLYDSETSSSKYPCCFIFHCIRLASKV